MPSQMNGSNASYSSTAELKNAHTCRCSRSMDRPKGIGSAVDFMSASRLRALCDLLAVKVLVRHQGLSLLQAVRDLDGEPIQRSWIELVLYLRFAKVHCEYAPEAAG